MISSLVVSLPTDQIFANLVDIKIDKLVFLGDFGSMFFGVNTWWTHQDDLRRFSRGVAVIQLKDSDNFFKCGKLIFGTIEFSDRA